MLKLSRLAAAATAVLHVKDETGEPMFYAAPATEVGEKPVNLPVQITVYGPASAEYRAAQLRAQRRVMALAKKGAKALDARTAEERAADTADLLTDITVSIDGIDGEGLGQRELAKALYGNPEYGYIADQVNAFAADWANFSTSAHKA